tara:strand:- start:567 stop:944 length:378 start_codon:yes stop_codon:yes gene_type:complete
MVRIEDKLGAWSGELKFSLDDDTEFCLKPKIKHKRKLLFLEKRFMSDKYTEKDLEEQDNVIVDILKEAYPKFTTEQIDEVIGQYGTEILMELYLAWKWRDRKTIEAFKKKQQKEVEKLLTEDVES